MKIMVSREARSPAEEPVVFAIRRAPDGRDPPRARRVRVQPYDAAARAAAPADGPGDCALSAASLRDGIEEILAETLESLEFLRELTGIHGPSAIDVEMRS